MLFKNLKFRILAGISLLLINVFLIFGYFFINSIEANQSSYINAYLDTVLKDLQHEYRIELNNVNEFEDVRKEFNLSFLYAQILVVENGVPRIIAKSKDLGDLNLPIENLLSVDLSYDDIFFYEIKNKQLAPDVIKVGALILAKDPFAIIQCGIPFNRHDSHIKAIEWSLGFGLLFFAILILVIVYFVVTKSLSATKEVLVEVKAIKIDGSEIILKKTQIADEIDDLIEMFNSLINQLQKSYKKVKEFGQNASHELKTPLTIIRGEVEIGLRKDRSNQEYKEILNSVMSELNLLQSTVEKILFLSSNADGDIIESFKEFYVDEVVIDSISEKQYLANKKNIEIKLLTLEPMSFIGNHFLFKIAVSNIIENAIKYSEKNSKINISLEDMHLKIQDFGIGIPENEIDKIFDKFYRVDKIRNKTFGSGLGLSIAKTICDLHKIEIFVESSEDAGTVFLLNLYNEEGKL